MRTALLLFFLLPHAVFAQFAPRNGWQGSTAMPKDSTIFIAWASQVQVERGWKDLRLPDSGKVSAGLPEMVIGKADGQAVSLGDGGWAVASFDPPVVNGPGADFAVFENGFHIRQNSDSDFLELAFVEVSSDGQTWVRFAAQSMNDTSVQLNTFDGSKASKVHNLAGKYTGGFGVPFDLDELKDSLGIDLMNIGYVRLIDVVGSLNDSFATRDAFGRKINDPFPTLFDQGGFDLDAIGVIYNQHSPNGLVEADAFVPYPNPSCEGQGIVLSSAHVSPEWHIYSIEGKLLESGVGFRAGKGLAKGIYVLRYSESGRWKTFKWVVQ